MDKGTLTMPASHTPAEVDLARELARSLELSELHVFWSARSRPQPPPFPLPGIARALSALGAISAIGGAFGWLSGHVDSRQPR